MIFSIDSASCCIVVDGINKSYYRNTVEDRAQMLEDCTAMNLLADYEQVIAEWGENVISPTLDELKTAKLLELETQYDIHVKGSFVTTQGYLMQFDTSDSIKMQGAITLMEAVGSSVGYLTQANDVTIYNVPIAIMKQVLVEMLNAYAQCHARKQELRAMINNAQTKEELDEIVISWPV